MISSFFDPLVLLKITWFLWLPFILGFLFWDTWMARARAKFLKSVTWTLLEIKIPREIGKSPQAMETVLNSLYTTYAGNLRKRFIAGFLPIWYSLEIASINGQVHFFVYVQSSFRNFLESQIYAHYPEIEIVEVDDYARAGNFENFNEWNLWGAEFGLNKADAYPIRTYIDFGLHEVLLKEEQKVNPLVSFLELLGSLKQGEQVWFQILIRGARSKWVDEAKIIKDEIMGRNKPVSAGEEAPRPPALSKGEQEIVAAIERNVSKLGFETGIRMIYLARNDVFNKVNTAALAGTMNQYNSQTLNGFKRNWKTDDLFLDFILPDKREAHKKREALNAYCLRSYFYAPYKRKPFVFNTEELATIYHFPGRVAETPTFGRVEAKKGEPPSTLPI